ncbi:MAG: hypothetical protein LBC38_02440 [Oscillospiraceae bacterium]|jgi:hypothetical protein|nr:hypothetical protein [Oscillospiraceae bacterium]
MRTRDEEDFDESAELEDMRIPAKKPVRRAIMTPLGGVGVVVAGLIIVASLVAQISVTRIAAENAELRRQYNSALAEQARLKLAFERAFDLTEIEREAKAMMGMRAATELQTVYIGAETSDRVIILKGGAENKGILGKISDILRNLSEYFK